MESGFLYPEAAFPVSAKKYNNFALNAIDIFADGMVYYVIDQRGFLMDFMVEDHRCDIFQLLK